MALVPGTRLGPYEIVDLLGAGSMGEVYRARDTRLDRTVAIKVLPPQVAADPMFRQRFEREAKTLAALNHTHIAQIYGFEQAGATSALVMELAGGEDLAQRIARGPILLDEAIAIARQIADALEAAHEQGIVHRDLKPANIKLRSDGTVKVLDFGLAKAAAATPIDMANSPTFTVAATQIGAIVGTPAYMAPEQARGKAVDKRADIWAFGCVLFEMLAGTRAFGGDTISDTIARLLEREPDWKALPREIPPNVRKLLERCLRKDPAKRLHDIADALIEIDDPTRGAEPDVALTAAAKRAATARTRVLWLTSALGLIVLTAVGAVIVLWALRDPVDVSGDSLQLTIPRPPETEHDGPRLTIALSPDGSYIVMALVSAGKEPTLWVRGLRSGDARELPGTAGAALPFWSPDSRRIAFFASGKLKTVAVDGSELTEICDTKMGIALPGGEGTTGGSWSQQGLILFWSETGPLQKVSTAGGAPVPVTALAEGEAGHGWPSFLPDGEHFLFLAYGAQGSNLRHLRVGSLRSKQSTALGPIRSAAVYASGHILYVDGGVMAQRFDVSSLRQAGDPQMLVPPRVSMWNGRGMFTVSDTGLLAFHQPLRLDSHLTWFDRSGNRLGTVGEPNLFFNNLALSPDDRRLAISLRRPTQGEADIYIIDLTRGADTKRLTTDPAPDHDPAWSPDGRDIVFNSSRGGRYRLFQRAADGSGSDELFAELPVGIVAPAFSPDGKFVIFDADGHLGLQSVEQDSKPVPFGNAGEGETQPSFSPDGRWVVYRSRRTGRSEIYVRPFPSGDRDYKVSLDGGEHPRWRSQGEILFLSLDARIMSARVTAGYTFDSAIPQQLFATGLRRSLLANSRLFDVTRDGQRFILPVTPNVDTTPVALLTNWTARLRE